MKKNDIIKMLQAIEGNPEIVLWNGYVGDFQHIDSNLVRGTLVKQTLSCYLETCRLAGCRDRNDFSYQLPEAEVEELKQLYKKVCKWEENWLVTENDIKEKRYSQKTVFYLQGKLRGVTYSDRCGSVSY